MTDEVPASVCAAVEGAWELGPDYHIELMPVGHGLRVHQEATTRLMGPIVRDDPVEYDDVERVLRFSGAGAIHRTEILFKPTRDGANFRSRSEVSPGRWIEGQWEPALRRGPDGA